LTEPITVERDGHVLLIGVNRPAKRNAFDLATIDALGKGSVPACIGARAGHGVSR
jgi:enoyl-CoA hydratase/carnithine racemase